MSRTKLDRPTLISTFLRCFVIQGSWNYHTMLGSGFAFVMLPGLRRLFADDPEALEASVGRHLEHFNAHPYLSGVAVGAALRLEAGGEAPELVRRFKTAVRGPLGGLGDSLVWASWLPAASLAALAMVWLGIPGRVAVLAFLLVYNAGHLALRAWAFRMGLRQGRRVAVALGAADLGRWTDRIRAGATLLLGLVTGALVTAPGGLLESGVLWVGLGAASVAVGLAVGQRAWRPAAGLVVATVTALAGWGLLGP